MAEPVAPRFVLLVTVALAGGCHSQAGGSLNRPVDGRAGFDWGSDHVGLPLPVMTSGDECLFCHRERVGATWTDDPHARSLRELTEDDSEYRALRESPPRAAEAEFVLGSGERTRLLRSIGYGRLALLEDDDWNAETFAASCSGCHATGADAETGTFVAVSLECSVCHGNVTADHTASPESVHLSPRREDDPRVAAAICAQCHARGGRSRSTGKPYPTHFVAGDNLFRDFEIDLSADELRAVSLVDRHVRENIRAVLSGASSVTCVSCHDVHKPSTRRHRRLPRTQFCTMCHRDGEDAARALTDWSSTCQIPPEGSH